MGYVKNKCKLLFRNSEGNELLKILCLRRENNIKIKLKIIALDWIGMDWISAE